MLWLLAAHLAEVFLALSVLLLLAALIYRCWNVQFGCRTSSLTVNYDSLPSDSRTPLMCDAEPASEPADFRLLHAYSDVAYHETLPLYDPAYSTVGPPPPYSHTDPHKHKKERNQIVTSYSLDFDATPERR